MKTRRSIWLVPVLDLVDLQFSSFHTSNETFFSRYVDSPHRNGDSWSERFYLTKNSRGLQWGPCRFPWCHLDAPDPQPGRTSPMCRVDVLMVCHPWQSARLPDGTYFFCGTPSSVLSGQLFWTSTAVVYGTQNRPESGFRRFGLGQCKRRRRRAICQVWMRSIQRRLWKNWSARIWHSNQDNHGTWMMDIDIDDEVEVAWTCHEHRWCSFFQHFFIGWHDQVMAFRRQAARRPRHHSDLDLDEHPFSGGCSSDSFGDFHGWYIYIYIIWV